jgi:hypothetical protein
MKPFLRLASLFALALALLSTACTVWLDGGRHHHQDTIYIAP